MKIAYKGALKRGSSEAICQQSYFLIFWNDTFKLGGKVYFIMINVTNYLGWGGGVLRRNNSAKLKSSPPEDV